MRFLQGIFSKKEKAEALTVREDIVPQTDSRGNVTPYIVDAWRYQQILSKLDGLVRPSVVGNNFIELFKTVPEVFWPIDFIAKRISEAHFDIKRTKDDSIVWCNRLGADAILKQPNPVMTWRELVYSHFVYKRRHARHHHARRHQISVVLVLLVAARSVGQRDASEL